MKARWCFSTLIIILTIFGAVYQQQISVPNQEIVFEFTDDTVSSDEAQNAIAIVKTQLQALGVENIRVRDVEGKLKIAYYSATDVASIKKSLSENKLELGYTLYNHDGERSKLPPEKNSTSYNLDVYEIENGNNYDSNLDGYVLELSPKSDRFFNPNQYMSVDDIDFREKNRVVKVAYRINRNIAIAIDNTSHNIPEVRAGPTC